MHHTGDLYRFLLARRVYILDVALALFLVLLSNPQVKTPEWNVAGQMITVVRTDAQSAGQVLATWWACTAVIVAGLLIQHRWPLMALALTSLGATSHALVRDPLGPQVGFLLLIDLAVPITLYTLASRGRFRRLSMAALGVLMLVVIGVGVYNQLGIAGGPDAAKGAPQFNMSLSDIQHKVVGPALTMLLALALAYALGTASRARAEHLRTLEQRAAGLEREQHQRVALATATERARIGRDLHDVVAHSLSVVVAQAQAALAAQHRHPERTTQAMREVITVGRESLAELRRLVGAFGPSPDTDRGAASQIGVAALPALVERVRAAGTPVHLTVTGPQSDLPAGVDVSAYRIVQEALTNILKHAGAGVHAAVHLTIEPGCVDVEVTDDGVGRPSGPPTEPGNGLRGIAERVNLLGGTLSVEAGPGDGFAVRARLPTSPAHPAPLAGIGAVGE